MNREDGRNTLLEVRSCIMSRGGISSRHIVVASFFFVLYVCCDSLVLPLPCGSSETTIRVSFVMVAELA